MDYCVFHNVDFDGECSAAIVKYYYDIVLKKEIILYGMNYGDEFTLWDKLNKEDTIYMVDFGLQPFEEMVLLNQVCNLIWIDHHATAIDNIEDSGIIFKGTQTSGIGACKLVWDFLFPDIEVPYGIKLLSEYDVWLFNDSNTLPFQYGMRIIHNTKPDSEIWDDIIDGDSNFIADTVVTGMTILQYEDKQNTIYCNAYAFMIEFEGYKAICINKGIGNSKVFNSVWDNNKYDMMLTFCYSKKGHWNIGMYTDKKGVHVGNVAKKYGGGGHAGAAGFQCNTLPFKIGE